MPLTKKEFARLKKEFARPESPPSMITRIRLALLDRWLAIASKNSKKE
jgi:hypothetical protein